MSANTTKKTINGINSIAVGEGNFPEFAASVAHITRCKPDMAESMAQTARNLEMHTDADPIFRQSLKEFAAEIYAARSANSLTFG